MKVIILIILWIGAYLGASATDNINQPETVACPTITLSQTPAGNVCQGSGIVLTATGCTGTGAVVGWYKDDPNSTALQYGNSLGLQNNTTGTSVYYAKCFTSACTNPTAESITIVVNSLPTTPVLASPTFMGICTNQSYIFEVTAVNGLSYIWESFPAGSVITPLTSSSNKISVQFPSSFTSGYVSVKSSNGICTSTSTYVYCTYNGSGTSQPSAFTQSTPNPCVGSSYTYTVPNDPTVSSYTWEYVNSLGVVITYPNISISSNRNNATVFYNANTPNGTLRVKAYGNGCESPYRSISISVKTPPDTPTSFIQAPANGCSGGTSYFEVSPVSGASSYTWSYSLTGATFSETIGNATNVSFATNAGTPGEIRVKSSNGFCESASYLGTNVVVTHTPPTPVMSSMPSSFCKGSIQTFAWNYDGYSKEWSYTGNGIAFDTYLNTTKVIAIANDASNGILKIKNVSGTCKSSALELAINPQDCCNPEESLIIQDEAVSANIGSGTLNLKLIGRLSQEASPLPSPLTGVSLSKTNLITTQNPLAPQNYNTSASCTVSANGMYYDVIPFGLTSGEGAFFVFNRTGTGSTGIVNIYDTSYEAATPCYNWLGSSSRWTEPSPDFLYFRNDYLQPNHRYIAVVARNSNAPYTLELQSYNALRKPYFILPQPNSLYNYTFMAIKSGTIIGFSTDGDFSNATIYTAGSYSIYGVSYKNGTNLNTYLGGALTSFQTAISSQSICAKLSNNSKNITITSCVPAAAPVVSTNKLIQCNNQAVMLTATGCSGMVKWVGNDTNLANFTGNTISTLTFPNTAYISAMCNNSGCLSNISNTVTIFNNTFSQLGETIKSNVTTEESICFLGQSVLLSVQQTATTAYQWSKDNLDIAGAVSSTYAASSIGKYRVRITEGTCSYTTPVFYIKPVPTSPIVAAITIPSNTSGLLTATSCVGGQINWYDAPSSGNKLASLTTSFNSPILSQTTNYYADCQTLGCLSSSRASGTININNPCPQNIIISSTTNPPHQAAEYITTSGTVHYATGNRLYTAGKSITITPPSGGGYWLTDKSTVFEAKIQGCL